MNERHLALRVEMIARGDVQRVEFRDVIQRIARNLGPAGTVQNLEPYDVRIVAEGWSRVQARDANWTNATGEKVVMVARR